MRVDYYLLDQSEPHKILQYTCRLLNKAYDAGLRTCVLTNTPQQSNALDQLLWTSADSNFIPHALVGAEAAKSPLTKICIASELPSSEDFDMLVSLQNHAQILGEDYKRVAELVTAEESDKIAARKRYAQWREKGADLKLHNINVH